MDFERLLKARQPYDSPLKHAAKIVADKKEMTPNHKMRNYNHPKLLTSQDESHDYA